NYVWGRWVCGLHSDDPMTSCRWPMDVIQKFQLIKSLPKEEQSKEAKVKEVKELISTLIQIKNHNPEISKIIEKDLPELLTKHASSLGPVVDEFLNKTP
ncbi:MAG: hypothetical protein O7C68_05100, partial [Rickettsia endosymbiont of Ixodes ricinus]|nr:hypothetical protein [Rickettsia endosymbiont of Ixodes ricinus]